MTDPAATARLGAIVARAQHDGRLPSVVAAIARRGQLEWVGAAGDVAGDPQDTQYRLGSITKTFTAVLVMQARNEGLISLDQPLRELVPEAPFGDRSIRALLAHAAGIPSEPMGDWWERIDGGDFATLARDNATAAPLLGPGEDFIYSNLGYGLLGEVVARVRGQSWWELTRDRILEPLGMRRTTYRPEGAYAVGYSVDPLLSTVVAEPDNDTGAMAPAGQLWSTLQDLAAYAGFLVDGHPDVLDRDALALMQSSAAPGGTYGLGFQLRPGGSGLLVGHTGTMPGFMARLQIDRARGVAALAFGNATVGLDPDGIAADMLAAWAERPEAPEPWRPVADVAREVRAIVGQWHWGLRPYRAAWWGDRLRITALDKGTDLETFRLVDGAWVDSMGVPLEVELAADGSVRWLRFDTYLLTRTPYDPTSPVPGGSPHGHNA